MIEPFVAVVPRTGAPGAGLDEAAVARVAGALKLHGADPRPVRTRDVTIYGNGGSTAPGGVVVVGGDPAHHPAIARGPRDWARDHDDPFAVAVIGDSEATLFCDARGSCRLFFGASERFIVVSDCAFAAAAAVGARPALAAVALLLTFDYPTDERGTLFEGVYRVPPGHFVTVDRGSTEQRATRWWSPTNAAADRRGGRVEIVEAALVGAVQRAVSTAAGRVGVLISGGLDSTLVAALAVEALGPQRVVTANLAFPGLECDEAAYAEAVARHLGCTLLATDPRRDPWIRPIEIPARDAVHLYNPTTLMLRPALEQLAEAGCDVVLTGLSSDALQVRLRAADVRASLTSANWLNAVRAARTGTVRSTVSTLRAALRPTLASGRFLDAPRWVGRAAAPLLAAPRRLPWPVRPQEVLAEACLDLSQERTAFEQTDLLARSVGVTLRHPFASRTVAEAFFALEPSVRRGLGVAPSKPLTRAMSARRLPPVIAKRKSFTHFGSFVDAVIRDGGPDIIRLLESGQLRRLGWLDIDRLVSAVQTGEQRMQILGTLAAELFLRASRAPYERRHEA